METYVFSSFLPPNIIAGSLDSVTDCTHHDLAKIVFDWRSRSVRKEEAEKRDTVELSDCVGYVQTSERHMPVVV